MVPLGNEAARRVRGSAQRIVVDRPLACPYPVDFGTDRDHRLTEGVDLLEVLTLGGLDHQCPGYREAHRRGVETVVSETLCHIVHSDTGVLGDRTQVENAFVGHHSTLARVEDGKVLVEAACDVVGRGDGRQAGPAESDRAHHPNVGPRDGQDGGASIGCRRNRSGSAEFRRQRVPGQERRQVGAHADGSDTGATAAVRDAERLVQVQVTDVAAEPTGSGQPDEGVEVGAVHVDLASGVVDGSADVGDLVLVHAVGGRVGDHDRGESLGMVGNFRSQVVEIDVTVGSAGHHFHAHTGHDGGRRVGAVGARGIRQVSRWSSPRLR